MRNADTRSTITGKQDGLMDQGPGRDANASHRDDPTIHDHGSEGTPRKSTGKPDALKGARPVWGGAAETGPRGNRADRLLYLPCGLKSRILQVPVVMLTVLWSIRPKCAGTTAMATS